MILVLRPSTRRVLAGVLALCGLALIGTAIVSVGGALPVAAKLEPLRRVVTTRNQIALTFDISWGTVMPPKVADLLKQYDVQSTIFVSGPWAGKNPDFVSRLSADDHELASHGYLHKNMSAYTEAQIEEAITKTHAVIKDTCGQEARFIRPPNGDYDDLVITTAARLGYTVVIWSLDSLDWLNPGVEKIVSRVLTRAQAGDVILMHASDTCKQTDLALPRVIEGLREKGFELVTLGVLADGARKPD